MALGVVFNATANILMKAAATQAGGDGSLLVRLFTQPALIGGVACFGVALGCYSVALTKFELSVAYPIMTSVGLILVFAFSVFGFKESVHLTKVLGTLLIIAGVVLVTRGNG